MQKDHTNSFVKFYLFDIKEFSFIIPNNLLLLFSQENNTKNNTTFIQIQKFRRTY